MVSQKFVLASSVRPQASIATIHRVGQECITTMISMPYLFVISIGTQ